MDAYSSYIGQLSEVRVADLRRETADRSNARAARSRRTSGPAIWLTG